MSRSEHWDFCCYFCAVHWPCKTHCRKVPLEIPTTKTRWSDFEILSIYNVFLGKYIQFAHYFSVLRCVSGRRRNNIDRGGFRKGQVRFRVQRQRRCRNGWRLSYVQWRLVSGRHKYHFLLLLKTDLLEGLKTHSSILFWYTPRNFKYYFRIFSRFWLLWNKRPWRWGLGSDATCQECCQEQQSVVARWWTSVHGFHAVFKFRVSFKMCA